jgi:PAS domain S-box-containing protein
LTKAIDQAWRYFGWVGFMRGRTLTEVALDIPIDASVVDHPVFAALSSKIAILEEELSKTRHELSHSLDYTNIPLRIINSDFTVRRVNRAFADMTGMSQEQVNGKKCWEIFAGPYCHTDNCRLRRVLRGEAPVEVEIDRVKQDGTSIPCVITASPLFDSSGEMIGVVEGFKDITENRLLQAQIIESEERYRALVKLEAEAGEAIVMLQDVDGREAIHIFTNDQWPHITGYFETELRSMSFFDLVSPIDRDNLISRYRAKISGQALPGLYEVSIIRKDGVIVPLEITGAATKYQGQRAIVAYIRDITARKQAELSLKKSENLYRAIFDTTGTSTFIVDSSGTVVLVNQEWTKIFGYTRDEAEGNKNIFELVPPDVLPNIRLKFDLRKTAPQEVPNSYFSQIVTREGLIKDVTVKVNMIPGTDMRVISFLDVTDFKRTSRELMELRDHLEELVTWRTDELKAANQELLDEIELRRVSEQRVALLYSSEQQLRQKLESQTAERITFTRALVHELKTPLTPLMAASEYLVNNLDGLHLEFALAVSRGAIRLEHRITELLDLTKGEVGLLELNCQIIDIPQFLDNLMVDIMPRITKEGQALTLNLPESMPRIKADAERLQQIMLNLIDNAIKFNRRNGGVVVNAKTDGAWVIIEIADEGEGINPDMIPLLFEPYKRSEKKWNSIGGLGLGLALSKALVKLHGGDIWTVSNKGQGSVFSFSLPI